MCAAVATTLDQRFIGSVVFGGAPEDAAACPIEKCAQLPQALRTFTQVGAEGLSAIPRPVRYASMLEVHMILIIRRTCDLNLALTACDFSLGLPLRQRTV
jgi:hypothetical protein